jgi:Na+/H+ antiporter NhaD/arsenite permease-like protein
LDLALLVFVVVYAGMILGRFPGLQIDRTGIALVGAVVLVAGGTLSTAAAWQAIDVATLALLLGLMLVSAQFRQCGFYTALTRRLAAHTHTPERLLLHLILVTGLLSALLTNDVVCLATAPVLIDVCVRRGFDPLPLLLGLAAASNVGSAATLIGNPQNMLIGQSLQLPFARYLLDGGVPALLGLLATWWILARSFRGRFLRTSAAAPQAGQPFHPWQTTKGLLVLGVVTVGFLTDLLPREVLAMAAGGVLLVSRLHPTRAMLDHVDWPLLLLFAGLFVVNHALVATGHAARGFQFCRDHGVDVADPIVLFVVSVVGSNVISNVPLTILLLPHVSHPLSGPILALATTLAGNLLLVGSIANLIVVDQAERLGVRPVGTSWFRLHLRTGVPITLATLAIASGWLWLVDSIA